MKGFKFFKQWGLFDFYRNNKPQTESEIHLMIKGHSYFFVYITNFFISQCVTLQNNKIVNLFFYRILLSVKLGMEENGFIWSA